VDVVWFDGRDGAGLGDDDAEIYTKSSADGGVTWSADLRLTHAAGTSKHASLAGTPDHLHVLWYDGRDGQTEIYYKRFDR
jgi:hypothetical protein